MNKKLHLLPICFITFFSITISCCKKNKEDVVVTPPVRNNIVDIPDPNFREELKKLNVDADNDGFFTEQEMKNASKTIVNLNLSGKDIRNLKGIEYFTQLEELNIEDNKLKTIDISKLNLLRKFFAFKNQLENTLDLSNQPDLSTCEIVKQGNNPNLTRIKVHNHLLASKFNSLENTQKYSTSAGDDFIELDQHLKYCLLHCNTETIDTDKDGQISIKEAHETTIIDFVSSTQLCSENENKIIALTGLENFKNLEILRINSNSLTSATIENFSQLTSLELGAVMKNITLSNLPKLQNLTLDSNKFSVLTLTDLPALKKLSLSHNLELTNLNINALTHLQELYLQSVPQITSLDLSGLINPSQLKIMKEGTNPQITGIKVVSFALANRFNAEEKTHVYYDGNNPPASSIIVNIPDSRFRSIIERRLNLQQGESITEQMLESITALNLDNNIRNLTGLEHFKKLKELNFNASVTHLNISKLTLLEKLTLGSRTLTSVQVGHLPLLKEVYLNIPIQKVDFSDCPSLIKFKISTGTISGIECIKVGSTAQVNEFEKDNKITVAGQEQNRNVFKTTCN